MRSSHSRIAAGVLLAVALGTFGPISRAVSMESRRHVEVQAPVGAYRWVPPTRTGHGAQTAVATWNSTTEFDEISLVVEQVFQTAFDSRPDETRASVDERPTVTLVKRRCVYRRSCEVVATWRSAGPGWAARFDVTPTSREFDGTITDSHGATCHVRATWTTTEPVDPTSPRFDSPFDASGSAQTSCLGDITWFAQQGSVYPVWM